MSVKRFLTFTTYLVFLNFTKFVFLFDYSAIWFYTKILSRFFKSWDTKSKLKSEVTGLKTKEKNFFNAFWPSTEDKRQSVDSTQRLFDVFLSGQHQGKTSEFKLNHIFKNSNVDDNLDNFL